MWCHIGISFLVFRLTFITSIPALYFLATFSISFISFGILLQLASDSCHVCMIQLILLFSSTIGFFTAFFASILSTMKAHLGLLFPGVRYFCSHIIWIASFLAFMSGIPRPPSVLLLVASFHETFPLFPFHRKSFISFCIFFSVSLGIPFTVARKSALDCTRAFSISSFPL